MKRILIALALLMSVAASAQKEVGQLMFWGNGERVTAEAIIKLRQTHPTLQQKLSELNSSINSHEVQKMISDLVRLYDNKNIYISVSNARGQFNSVRLSIDVGWFSTIRRKSQLNEIYKSPEVLAERLDASRPALAHVLTETIKNRKAELAKAEAQRKKNAQTAAIILMMDDDN